ncbi:hypothetical protein HHK36_010486 [Tetracentron sinense]|uniref:Dolichyl-diphosphooligosaccharide--protein glycosyltransferase subunit 1 n=1 Tax=Tetracentron sinense TaxID=13715 RepID=A0A834ZCX0_TETSI|nr:hypothetical protein HHK36_010486 [Tetracentron sinense]
MGFRFNLFVFSIAILSTPVLSDLILSKVDRRIDLTSQIARITSTLKVKNAGNAVVSQLLLAFPDHQAKNLAYLTAVPYEGKGKQKASTASLPIDVVHPEGMPPALTLYSVSLPKGLAQGESLTLDVLAVFTHSLQPFPEQISQADIQLVVFQDSAYYLSPYEVKGQSLSVRLPSARVESYTKIHNTKFVDREIKYGPYENLPSFSYSPIAVHFENNEPFAVAKQLVREIEISHWGNVQVVEHYDIAHGGAHNKGGFSRIDYQARPHIRGASSFRRLIARLPASAHSVYYRDQIGNISTSHLWGDYRKTELEIEPRYPMFGGWRTSFTIGYGVPLQEFLFELEGKRFLNITFGCPMNEVVVDNLIVKARDENLLNVDVALPEGSRDISVSVPFPVNQWQEVKFSHLDIVGRPVVVLEKTNVIPEHNVHFQVFLLPLLFIISNDFFLLLLEKLDRLVWYFQIFPQNILEIMVGVPGEEHSGSTAAGLLAGDWRGKGGMEQTSFECVVGWLPSSSQPKGFVEEGAWWINIFGLPLHAWCSHTMKAIGDACGAFIHVDTINKARILIENTCWQNIPPVLLVEVARQLFDVRVVGRKGHRGWCSQSRISGFGASYARTPSDKGWNRSLCKEDEVKCAKKSPGCCAQNNTGNSISICRGRDTGKKKMKWHKLKPR